MHLINLTSHAVYIRSRGSRVAFAPSGTVARVETLEARADAMLIAGHSGSIFIETVSVASGHVVIDTPDGTLELSDLRVGAGMGYIVSEAVLAHKDARADFFAPGPRIYDADSKPIGHDSLRWKRGIDLDQEEAAGPVAPGRHNE